MAPPAGRRGVRRQDPGITRGGPGHTGGGVSPAGDAVRPRAFRRRDARRRAGGRGGMKNRARSDQGGRDLPPTPAGRCLNVGCGRDLRAGWVNVDVEAVPGAIRASITHLPLQDGALDYVLASHVLEHVPDVKRAIAELARILRTGGTLEIRAPDYRHENAYTDLEHLHFFTPRSM